MAFTVSGYVFIGNRLLEQGTRVIVKGIKSKPEWNYKRAIIEEEYDSRSGRYGIRMEHDETQTGKVKRAKVMGIKFETKRFDTLEAAAIHVQAIYTYHIDYKCCNNCWKLRTYANLKRCGGCVAKKTKNEYIVRYCNRDCQKSDWKKHREICGKLYE